MRMSRVSLRGAGLPERLILCSGCGDDSCDHYLALTRTAPLQLAPLPHGALRLACVDCLARAALAAGVPQKPKAVGTFMDKACMGSCEACWQIMGFAQCKSYMPGFRDEALY